MYHVGLRALLCEEKLHVFQFFFFRFRAIDYDDYEKFGCASCSSYASLQRTMLGFLKFYQTTFRNVWSHRLWFIHGCINDLDGQDCSRSHKSPNFCCLVYASDTQSFGMSILVCLARLLKLKCYWLTASSSTVCFQFFLFFSADQIWCSV